MKWKTWPKWKKGGFLLGILMSFFISSYLFTHEFIGCSRANWQSMCGTGLTIFGSLYGLGFSYLPVLALSLIVEPLKLGPNVSYLIYLTGLTIGTFITYFLIGSFVGYIFGKLSQRKKYLFLGIVIAILVWILCLCSFEKLHELLYLIRERNAVPIDINHPEAGMEIPCGPICGIVKMAVDFIVSPFCPFVFIVIGAFLGWKYRRIHNEQSKAQ